MADGPEKRVEVWTRKDSMTYIESEGWIQVQVDDETAIRLKNPLPSGTGTTPKNKWDGEWTSSEKPGSIESFGVQDPDDAPRRRMRVKDPDPQFEALWRPYDEGHSQVICVGLSDGEEPETIVAEGPEVPEGESIRHALVTHVLEGEPPEEVKQVHNLGIWPPPPPGP